MARKGENIFKRKDGRWEGRFIRCHENDRAKYSIRSAAVSLLSSTDSKAAASNDAAARNLGF